MLVQFDINLNELLYDDLPCDTFAQRLSKAKIIAGFSQKTLSEATGLSQSTINELDAGYRDNITKDTLLKLISVLDKEILCDDYCNFILNQEQEIRKLINKYSIKNLSNLLHLHRSTLEKWRDGKNQVSRNQYNKICLLIR
jgi:Helix-turn-helix.